MDGRAHSPAGTRLSGAEVDGRTHSPDGTRRRALADGRIVEVAAQVSDAELTAIAAALERRVPTPVWRRAGIVEAVSGAAPAAPSEGWGGAGGPGSPGVGRHPLRAGPGETPPRRWATR